MGFDVWMGTKTSTSLFLCLFFLFFNPPPTPIPETTLDMQDATFQEISIQWMRQPSCSLLPSEVVYTLLQHVYLRSLLTWDLPLRGPLLRGLATRPSLSWTSPPAVWIPPLGVSSGRCFCAYATQVPARETGSRGGSRLSSICFWLFFFFALLVLKGIDFSTGSFLFFRGLKQMEGVVFI